MKAIIKTILKNPKMRRTIITALAHLLSKSFKDNSEAKVKALLKKHGMENENPTDWHIHKNGGGLVHNDAMVFGNAYVAKDARVFKGGFVSSEARVEDRAVVAEGGQLTPRSTLSGDSILINQRK